MRSFLLALLMLGLMSTHVSAEPVAFKPTSLSKPYQPAVSITITGGLGWVDMGQFGGATESYFAQLDQQVDGFERRGSVSSHLLLAFGVRSQLRLPRHLFLETGLDILRHRRQTPIAIGAATGEIGFTNTSLALPFALGVHVPATETLALFASAGPVLLITSRSDWDYTLGEVSSFRGGVGGGFETTLGVDVAIRWRVHATAHVRYRFAKSGELVTDGPMLPPLQPVTELGWKSAVTELGLRVTF